MYRRDLRNTELDGLLADVATVDAAVQAAPGPDGRIAYAKNREDRTDLWLLADGSESRLTSDGILAMRRGRTDTRWIDWSPDGDHVAVVTADGGLATVDVTTGDVTELTDWDGGIAGLSWGEPGIAVVTDQFSRGSLAVVAPDGSRIDVRADDEFLYGDPRWLDDRLVATRSPHRHHFDYEAGIVAVDGDGDVDLLFHEEAVRAACPRPRPGGGSDELAFVHDATGFDAVYALDASDVGDGTTAGGDDEADGTATGGNGSAAVGDATELYAAEGVEIGAPAWNADGDELAVTTTADGRIGVSVVEVDGAALDGAVGVRTVADGDAKHTVPAWDGDRLISVRDDPVTPAAVVETGSGERIAPGGTVGLDERLTEPEPITYDSGGLEIHAMVHPPADDTAPDSVPLLVNPHGGPTTFDGFGFDYRASYFAALGYAVVRPNYRGSDGFGRAFRMANDGDWGGGDLDDVIASADAAAERYAAIDGDRVGIYGGSGGGLMTVNALGNSDRFRCGAAFYGVYDYETFLDDTDDVGWQLMKRELGDLVADLERYRADSPIRTVPDIDDPLAVLHGEEDVRVPISQSEQLVAELEAHDKRHEFRRYDGEPHGFSRRDNVVDAYTRVADLFAKYLQRYPDDGSSRPYEPPE